MVDTIEGTESSAEEIYGHWGAHPRYSPSDWVYDVVNDDTRLGYWEWVEKQIEEEREREDESP